jgi:glycogen debranching enzyme
MVHERARLGFAPPRPETEPLLIADVAMSAILCRAEEDIAWLGRALGVDTPGASTRRARLAAAFDQRLWDDQRQSYCDLDVGAGAARIPVEHIANYVPLFAGVVSQDRARVLAGRLADPALYAAAWPVPTVPLADPAFEPRRYWRGPTWINVNWMLIHGLRRAGFDAQAARLTEQTIELVARSGFREYYDCRTGEGCGADDFTWTASLVIDLLAG